MKIDPFIRFAQKVVFHGHCWLWTGGSVGPFGYGQMRDGYGNQVLAHRYAYETFRTPIPAGKQLDHICRIPRCVNPLHLEIVTPMENVRRGLRPRTCMHTFPMSACKICIATRRRIWSENPLKYSSKHTSAAVWKHRLDQLDKSLECLW